jgi:RecA-family ATPase
MSAQIEEATATTKGSRFCQLAALLYGDPLIPALNVALLYGDGGLGKSLIAMQLAVARAVKQMWLGLKTAPGRTLVLSAEDDANELHRRLATIALHYKVKLGDLGDIRLIDLVGQDAVIGELSRSGRIVATELFRFVSVEIARFNPGLVIVDALADSFAGDENNRTQARQFISMLRRVTGNHNCSFLTLAHPSLSGISTGRGTSGTTGWSNSVRSRMYLETVEANSSEADPNLKVLRQPKANYSAGGFEIAVRYENGVYVQMEGSQPLDRMAKMAQHDNAFLAILKRLTEQERYVSDSPKARPMAMLARGT